MNDKSKIKPSFNQNRQILGEIYPLDTPFTVIIDASEVCNFKCNYCFRSSNNKETWGYAACNKLMDWDLFVEVVNQIKDFPGDVKHISLSNHGEPLVNRDVPKMVRYIKEQGIDASVSIHTNASLLNENYSIELAESGIDRIVVSLQGLDSEIYKDVCSADIEFDELYSNLKCLYQHSTNTQICYKIMDVALKEGQEELFYDKFEPIGHRVFVEKMVPIWKNVEIPNVNTFVRNKYGDEFPLQKCCTLVFNTIVVNPEGDVYPCTQVMSTHKLGNVKTSKLVDMWNGEQRKDILIRQCKLDNYQICEDCYIKQNSIYSKEDMIDEYRDIILSKLLYK